MSKELEVIPADVAARLDEHKALIIQWDAGIKQAVDEFETYAFLCGRELLRAKEVVPHGNKDKNGGLMKWVEANFPDMPYKMATRRMAFAETVQAKLDTVSNFKPDLLLTPSRELNTEAVKLIREAVHEVMDGKSMTAFLRDEGVIREKKPAAHHPRKGADPLASEEEQTKAANEDWMAIRADVELNLGVLERVTAENREALLASLLKATTQLRALGKKKKKAKLSAAEKASAKENKRARLAAAARANQAKAQAQKKG